MMLGDARRFWAKACKNSGKEWRFRIGGWHRAAVRSWRRDDAAAGFNLTWLTKTHPITTHEYRLDHVHDKGLEGNPAMCSTLAMPVPPTLRRTIVMEPMPERSSSDTGTQSSAFSICL